MEAAREEWLNAYWNYRMMVRPENRTMSCQEILNRYRDAVGINVSHRLIETVMHVHQPLQQLDKWDYIHPEPEMMQ